MLNQYSEDEIYSILRIPVRFRIKKHIQTLMSITESVTFFRKIFEEYNSSVVHEKCCEIMTLEEYSESDVIINFGEIGDKFFIIFKGSVSVMVPTTETIKLKASEAEKYKNQTLDSDSELSDSSSDDLDTFILPNKRERREGIPVACVSEIIERLKTERKSMLKKKPESEELTVAKLFSQKFKQEKKEIVKIVRECDNDYIEIEISKLEVVNILKEGGCFGELALISDRPRAATIVANGHVSLLVIHKYQFRRILGNIASERQMLKVKFLQSLPFFASWTKSAISKISVFFDGLTFQRNQVLFTEGQEVKEIYFIREGEILITKQQKVSSNNTTVLKNQKVLLKNKELKMCIKGKGEIAGGYEILNNIPNRVYGCVCHSTVSEVFVIRKDNFLNRIPHFELIKEVLISESERLEERLKEVTTQDMTDFVGDKSKIKFSSPLRSMKYSFGIYNLEKSLVRSFNTAKSPPIKINRNHSRKITKGEIFRAVNPSRPKVEIKPKAIKYFTVRKTPPPNFMLRSRGDSRWNIANKRLMELTSKDLESSY